LEVGRLLGIADGLPEGFIEIVGFIDKVGEAEGVKVG
jgi:hypothetical protein